MDALNEKGMVSVIVPCYNQAIYLPEALIFYPFHTWHIMLRRIIAFWAIYPYVRGRISQPLGCFI